MIKVTYRGSTTEVSMEPIDLSNSMKKQAARKNGKRRNPLASSSAAK